MKKMATRKNSQLQTKLGTKEKAKLSGRLFHYRSSYLAAETNMEHPEMAGASMFH